MSISIVKRNKSMTSSTSNSPNSLEFRLLYDNKKNSNGKPEAYVNGDDNIQDFSCYESSLGILYETAKSAWNDLNKYNPHQLVSQLKYIDVIMKIIKEESNVIDTRQLRINHSEFMRIMRMHEHSCLDEHYCLIDSIWQIKENLLLTKIITLALNEFNIIEQDENLKKGDNFVFIKILLKQLNTDKVIIPDTLKVDIDKLHQYIDTDALNKDIETLHIEALPSTPNNDCETSSCDYDEVNVDYCETTNMKPY